MTALPSVPQESSHRSTFVTVVGWLFVGLSALATLGALLGILALAVVPATIDAAINRVGQDTTVTNLLPAPYRFMLHHVQLVALIKLAWWCVVLIASIGVLRRREWARRTFVAVLGVETVLVIAGFVMGQAMGMELASQLAARSQSGQVPPGMGTGLALAGLIGVAIVAILVWLFVSFRSARVREEFGSGPRAA